MSGHRLPMSSETAIRANEVLNKLDPSAMEQLARSAAVEKLERGAIACHQGMAAVRFWLVLSGKIKLLKYASTGLPLLIDIVLPNQLFGAVIYEDQPLQPCTALAAQPTELLTFRLKDFLNSLDHNPTLQKALLLETSRKLAQAQHMRVLGLEEASIRIAYLLLQLHEKFDGVI